jgi:hypothetical protein
VDLDDVRVLELAGEGGLVEQQVAIAGRLRSLIAQDLRVEALDRDLPWVNGSKPR